MSDSDSVASCRGLTWGYDAWGNRTEIKTIAMIGAGTMGRSIACCSPFGCYRTILEDVRIPSCKRGSKGEAIRLYAVVQHLCGISSGWKYVTGPSFLAITPGRPPGGVIKQALPFTENVPSQ